MKLSTNESTDLDGVRGERWWEDLGGVLVDHGEAGSDHELPQLGECGLAGLAGDGQREEETEAAQPQYQTEKGKPNTALGIADNFQAIWMKDSTEGLIESDLDNKWNKC